MKKYFILLMLLVATSCNLSSSSNQHIIMNSGSNAPIISLSLFTPLGSAKLDRKGGETALLSKILNQSSLATLLEKYGASYQIQTTKDSFTWNIVILQEVLEPFLQEFIPALNQYQISEKQINLAKQQVLEDIQFAKSSPEKKSALLYQSQILKDHPYGNTLLNTEQTLVSITSENIQDLMKVIFSQNYLYFIVSHQQAEQYTHLFSHAWGTLPQASITYPNLPVVSSIDLPYTKQTLDKQLSQSFVNIGLLLPPIILTDKPLILFLTEIIGGGFNSRLFKILRAKHGLSYSPHSGVNFLEYTTMWNISYSTKTESTSYSIDVVYAILDDLKNNGVTEEEFITTQKLLLSRVAKSQESDMYLNTSLASDILFKNPLGSINDLEQNIRKLTKDKLNQYIKTLLSTYPIVSFILAGDNAKR